MNQRPSYRNILAMSKTMESSYLELIHLRCFCLTLNKLIADNMQNTVVL